MLAIGERVVIPMCSPVMKPPFPQLFPAFAGDESVSIIFGSPNISVLDIWGLAFRIPNPAVGLIPDCFRGELGQLGGNAG